jgi:hypothetical protein
MSKSGGNWNAKILANEDKLETIALLVEFGRGEKCCRC